MAGGEHTVVQRFVEPFSDELLADILRPFKFDAGSLVPETWDGEGGGGELFQFLAHDFGIFKRVMVPAVKLEKGEPPIFFVEGIAPVNKSKFLGPAVDGASGGNAEALAIFEDFG